MQIKSLSILMQHTSQEQMYDRLQKINSQIDEFIQEKLGNRYKDILDYNINTPNRAEPVTLLVLHDFPSGMDGRSIDLLTNILRNGNKCGVFTMICYNPNITFSRYESIDERLEQISKFCASIDYKDGHYGLLPYNLQINIPESLSFNATDAFIADYIEKSEIIKKQGLSFKDIISKDLFSMDSSKSLKIPVGVGDGDSIINITIGEGSSHHGLIAGATGSGKSTLLHTLIMSSIIAVTDIFEDFLVAQGHLRSEHIRFIFHPALLHIEDIELFEAARFHSFLSVQNIVPDLVEHNDAFHHRMQIVFNEDKSVTHQNLIGSTLSLKIHGDDFDAKLTSDPVRISRAERIDQPICCLYNLQSLNIQERTPPSAYFGNSILT